jgi:hypothetical protein
MSKEKVMINQPGLVAWAMAVLWDFPQTIPPRLIQHTLFTVNL